MVSRRRTARPKGIQARLLAAGSPRVLRVLSAGVAALQAQGTQFCLVGGLARAFLAEARSTKDVDFAVRAESEAHADEIVRGMQSSGFFVRELFQRHDGALATARLTLGDSATRCDLLFSTSGLEHLVVAEAETRELAPGTRAPVIRRPHLIAMKLVAGRGQDRVDIEALLDAATADEVEEIPRALRSLDPKRRLRATALWVEIAGLRREREPDLFPAPDRLRALQRRRPK